MLSRLDTFTGLKVTHVNPTYHSKMEGHVIFTFTLFQIYELGGVGWRSPVESCGQIILYIYFISDILAWRRGVEESRGITWSDTPLYSPSRERSSFTRYLGKQILRRKI